MIYPRLSSSHGFQKRIHRSFSFSLPSITSAVPQLIMDNLTFPSDRLPGSLDRTAVKNHLPAVIWFTGLSGSGKSTLANSVEAELNRRFKAHTYILDGDVIRAGLNSDLGFSKEDREENIRRVGEVALLFVDAGLILLTAFISPFRKDRERVKQKLPAGTFLEIFVQCPLEVCEDRDPKGHYARARKGEIKEFTGVASPYEEPRAPDLVLQTDRYSVEECTRQVIRLLLDRSILRSGK